MPSILSRLRIRTLSQHSNASAQSAATPVSPPLLPPTDPPALTPSRSEPLLVDRRIVEDLPALLGSLEASHAPPGVLRPSRPRKRSGLGSLSFRPTPKDTVLVQDATSEKENPTSPAVVPSAWKGKQRQASTASPWSTFGRHRRHARSPYGGASHAPSARSSRKASVDSTALRSSSVSNVGAGEGQPVSNLTSSASIDLPTDSRLTESSRDVSVLSALTGSLSNRSSHSHNSAAVTFGMQSPPTHDMLHSPFQLESAALVAYTSMPVLPSTYSTESVPSRIHTFPSRRKKLKSRATSAERDVSEQLIATADRDLGGCQMTQDSHDLQNGLEVGPLKRLFAFSGGADERPGTAEPHVLREGTALGIERPCSPPRLIPPHSSPSSSPTSSRLLDAESRSDGVTDNLSRSYTTNLLVRAEEGWMADPRNATATLTRQPSDTRDASRKGASTASRTSTPSRTRSKRASHLSEQSSPITSASYSSNGGAGPSSAAFPTISTPPSLAPQRVPRTPRTASEPGLRSVSEKSGYETPLNNKGKRKAEEVDITPPDQRTAQHTTFVIPTDGRRSNHVSEVSRAPSSYHGRKRVRLSTSSSVSPSHSRPTSVQRHPTDSWPSRSAIPAALHRVSSKSTSTRSAARPESMSAGHRHDRRRSMSEISFPISALVAPHAPSVSVRSGGYYMRDPRKPPRVQPTPWSLRKTTEDEQGSPVHAWMFFIGFLLFPLWWIASFWRIPQTRRVGGTDTEKAVTLDDPQVEHDARSWRLRCRIMSMVSFFTYIPFIVLVAIFVPRS